MANRFEQPIASEFINTFVPIPFQEMMQAGQMKQQRYDQGAAAADATIQRAEMLNAVPGSPDEEYKKEALQKMYDIQDKYVGKDLSDSFVLRQMNNDINMSIDKNRLQTAELNWKSWGESEKTKRDLASKNLYNPLLDTDDPRLYDATKGVRNYIQKAYIDKNEMFSPYFKDVKNDINYLTEENGYTREVYGVSDEKIREQLSNAEHLVGTPMGAAYVEQWRQLNPDVEKDAVDILRDEMYDVGKAFARTEKRTLGASLQGGGKVIPNRFQLYIPKGGEITNFKNVREIEKKIEEYKTTGKEQEANDLSIQLESFQNKKTESVKGVAKKEISGIIDKLITTNQFNSREEAFDYIQKLTNTISPSNNIVGFGRGVGEWAANALLGLAKGIEDVSNVVGSAGATLMTKDVGAQGKSFKQVYKKWRESAPDYLDNIPWAGDIRKQRDVNSIIMEGFKNMNYNVSKQEDKEDMEFFESEKGISHIKQYQSVVSLPVLKRSDLSFNVDVKGTPMGISNMGTLAQKLFIGSEDFMVTSVNGKLIKDTDDKKSGTSKEIFKNKDYEVYNISPSLKMDPTRGYAPEMEITYKSTKTEDSGTNDFWKKITVSLNDPSHRLGLIEDLYKSGDIPAAYILSHPEVAQKIDTEDLSKGIKFNYRFPDGSIEPVTVKGEGNDFSLIIDFGDKEPTELKFTNREELKNELYNIAVSNSNGDLNSGFIF